MTEITIECYKCDGTGEITSNTGPPLGSVCPLCGGSKKQQVGIFDITDDLADLTDKVNDVMDKCNDIFEKVNE